MAENNLGSTQYFRSKPDQDLEVKEILDLAEHEHIAGILSQLIDTLGEDRARALTDGINEAVSALEHIV